MADAIDTVRSKIELLRLCREAGVPVISCMGAGNKLDPTAFRVAPLEKTSVCPLARVMRRELKKRGITGVKAVYSTEEALTPQAAQAGDTKGTAGRPTPGSMAFVPAWQGSSWRGRLCGICWMVRSNSGGGRPSEAAECLRCRFAEVAPRAIRAKGRRLNAAPVQENSARARRERVALSVMPKA